jgi:hypothetical protein
MDLYQTLLYIRAPSHETRWTYYGPNQVDVDLVTRYWAIPHDFRPAPPVTRGVSATIYHLNSFKYELCPCYGRVAACVLVNLPRVHPSYKCLSVSCF